MNIFAEGGSLCVIPAQAAVHCYSHAGGNPGTM